MKKFVLLLPILLFCCLTRAQGKRMVVAVDGSGRYRTVQAALDAVPPNNKKRITIYIKNGIYREKLHLDSGRNFVSLVGEDKFGTVLTYDDHTGKLSPKGDTINTRTSASFVVKGHDFSAANLTIQNTAGFTAGQAVGLEVRGDRAVIRNCRIVGNQDILFTSTAGSRQYYENCYIEGTTDFIFGAATVWFEKCHIHSRKNSHVTAASTPKERPYGYVFYDCVLTADTALDKVSLGRPWGPFAHVAYLRCYLGPHLIPEGWAAWNRTESYKTARYAEYKNYGPGFKPEARVPWSRQLSDEEAARYTLKNVLGGWDPVRNNGQ